MRLLHSVREAISPSDPRLRAPGALYLGNRRTRFLLWAPGAERVELQLVAPRDEVIDLPLNDAGYRECIVEDLEPGALYFYRLDGGRDLPDPASRSQPHGIHGPSQVIDPDFDWHESGWRGLPLHRYVTYELHTGTFTAEGTFDTIIRHLDELCQLGITAIELMPIAQFPGERNWGYDGVFPYAAQNSYGGPDALKRLVNACHQMGLAVVLDVVYNHLGPEGNYLGAYGPYFTDRYRTPWGAAINYDGPGSDEVRRFFIQSALYWVAECRIDALRLDAIHGIFDCSARPFIAELCEAVHRRAADLGRRVHLIAESDLNDVRVLQPRLLGGLGFDAQWNDDFHHALHALLTGERAGYYSDFGALEQFGKAWTEGFIYSGEYSSRRKRRHGSSSRSIEPHRFVVFGQNHDHVGNRVLGERLNTLVSFEATKLAAAAVVLSPFLPLLFMGEEYGETAPFQYFVSHSDPALLDSVCEGRRKEFPEFHAGGEFPVPGCEETFLRSKLDHRLKSSGRHAELWNVYRELFRLRRDLPSLAMLSKENMQVAAFDSEELLAVLRSAESEQSLLLLHFGKQAHTARVTLPAGMWHKRFDSSELSSLPESLKSSGEVTLTLAPESASLFSTTEPRA